MVVGPPEILDGQGDLNDVPRTSAFVHPPEGQLELCPNDFGDLVNDFVIVLVPCEPDDTLAHLELAQLMNLHPA